MDVLSAIEGRASAVKLGEPGPGRIDLDRIIAAGARAPDHGRLGPWRFVILEGAGRDVLAEAMVAAKRAQSPEATEAELDRVREKAARAPVIVAAAAHVTDLGRKIPAIEQVVAVGAAVQNMILAAHALGYGTMWKTGDAAYDPLVKEALGLDPAEEIVGFVYLGTAVVPGHPRAPLIEGRVRRL